MQENETSLCGHCGRKVIHAVTPERRRFLPGPKDYQVRWACTYCGRTGVVKEPPGPVNWHLVAAIVLLGCLFTVLSPRDREPASAPAAAPAATPERSSYLDFDRAPQLFEVGDRVALKSEGGRAYATIKGYYPKHRFRDGSVGSGYKVVFDDYPNSSDYIPAATAHHIWQVVQ